MNELNSNTGILLAWPEWSKITKGLYLAQCYGWPRAEMVKYWRVGYMPKEAVDAAVARRCKDTAGTA